MSKLIVREKEYELVQDKTNQMACAPSEVSDCALKEELRTQAVVMRTVKTSRRVFAGRTCYL